MTDNRRRSSRALFASWAVYWAGLAAVKLGPLALAVWRATRGHGGSSTVNASFANFVISCTVTSYTKVIYSGSAHLLTIAAWVAVPPLVTWAAWMAARPKDERLVMGVPADPTLPEPMPDPQMSGNLDTNRGNAPDSIAR